MSESLRNNGRIWVPKNVGDHRAPSAIPESERDYYLERKYPSFGNLVPRDVASRSAKEVCDDGRGVGESGLSVYLDFRDDIKRLGRDVIQARYGNLFEMYNRITGEDPYSSPMRIFPAVHYTMGGLWVDYHLQSSIPGLFVLGEANFSDHGANRLGASALMQGLADGYFVAPYVVPDYLASTKFGDAPINHPSFDASVTTVRGHLTRILRVGGRTTPREFHRKLGHLMWDHVGMARNLAGLERVLREIPALRDEFWRDIAVPGSADLKNQSLEYAGRVADYLEFAEVMALDALERTESCGGHFREESQTSEGEALRDDDNFAHVAAWEFTGVGVPPVLHREKLEFEYAHPTQRSYR
jgi:succinate dehydrogenase / fumarate reductase flavoprotein subunit